jgi:hypothetical protein
VRVANSAVTCRALDPGYHGNETVSKATKTDAGARVCVQEPGHVTYKQPTGEEILELRVQVSVQGARRVLNV